VDEMWKILSGALMYKVIENARLPCPECETIKEQKQKAEFNIRHTCGNLEKN
jgi:hypothetical protein